MRRKIPDDAPRLTHLRERRERLTIGDSLETRGWTVTRAGRWLDPMNGRSYTTTEAWTVIDARGF